MKKYCSISLMIVMLITLLCSCSFFEYSETYDSYEGYSNICSHLRRARPYSLYTELEASEMSIQYEFGEEGKEVVDFYGLYIEHLPLGEEFQILLSVSYDNKVDFDNEVSRISSLKYEKAVIYDEEHFNYPAYVAVLGWNNCSEYVLVNEEESILTYVYLQSALKEDVAIESQYLPNGYSDYGTVSDVCINIYEEVDNGAGS